MTDRQAAEARVRVAAIRKRLRWFAGRTTLAGNEMAAYVRELCDMVDALSVRLAQAERALRLDDELEMERNTLRARLREYEEALRIIRDCDVPGSPPREIAGAVLAFRAASGGREAPDTKEPNGS